MILSAHQPVIWPYLGTFAKIAQANSFVLFDGVQFERHGYSNRVRIKTANGPEWLTVPVFHGQPLLKDAKIDGGHRWRRKMLRTVELAYRKAPYFNQFFPLVANVVNANTDKLTSICDLSIRLCCQHLGIETPIVHASDYTLEGEKSDLVLNMCRKLKADKYIFGPMGRDYADLAAFRAAGIEVEFQAYRHPTYAQLHGGEFVPGLSILDLLMNEGPRSREILLSGITSPAVAAMLRD